MRTLQGKGKMFEVNSNRRSISMKNLLYKTVDIICIVLELIFTVVSFPFKVAKAVFDITKIILSN